MALVRVYCGVATAELAPWLTVAVVDDSGRLLDVRHLSDDPAGYAYLVGLLADRSAGGCPVAVDHHEHIVAQLVAAANRPIAVADEPRLRDFADRFVDNSSFEELQAPPSQRRAVGLARALQAGALYATAQSPSWDLDEIKPLLAAHDALVSGRQAGAATLREVLRELYPAALRAYLDPAELIPLTVLEAFPEPSALASAQSLQAVVAELVASGLTDATTATNAVNALRVAADELRGRDNPAMAPAVAQVVRHSISAIRACDAATNGLVASLTERLTAALAGVTTHSSPVSPAAPRSPVPAPVEAVPAWAAMGAAAVGAPPYEPVTVGATHGGIPGPRSEPRPGEPGHVPGRSDWSDATAASVGAPPRGRATVAAPARQGGWEQQFGPAPTSPAPRTYGPETLSYSGDPLTAPLDAAAAAQANGHAAAPAQRAAAPAADEDLLIFSQANSVWFTHAEDDTQVTWTNLTPDDGWRAAGQINDPSVGPDTTAGLPRRVPQANLVPGSVTIPARTPRIVRDARKLAAHTEGYFRGWRRGQEIGGYSVGQRERGAWEFNREQRARQGAARLS